MAAATATTAAHASYELAILHFAFDQNLWHGMLMLIRCVVRHCCLSLLNHLYFINKFPFWLRHRMKFESACVNCHFVCTHNVAKHSFFPWTCVEYEEEMGENNENATQNRFNVVQVDESVDDDDDDEQSWIRIIKIPWIVHDSSVCVCVCVCTLFSYSTKPARVSNMWSIERVSRHPANGKRIRFVLCTTA